MINTWDAGSTAAALAAQDAKKSERSTAASTARRNDAQEKFFKLLISQMKDQDPLKPLDDALYLENGERNSDRDKA